MNNTLKERMDILKNGPDADEFIKIASADYKERNKMKKKLDKIVEYMNERFSQASSEYSLICGAKPLVIRFDPETAISTWACGAVVCIKHSLFFISEDDGHWFYHSINDTNIALQNPFSVGWIDDFAEALRSLNKYLTDNGKPVLEILGTNDDGSIEYGDIAYYELSVD